MFQNKQQKYGVGASATAGGAILFTYEWIYQLMLWVFSSAGVPAKVNIEDESFSPLVILSKLAIWFVWVAVSFVGSKWGNRKDRQQ